MIRYECGGVGRGFLAMVVLAVAAGAGCAADGGASALGPADGSDLVLRGPIERWDEAIPLGNGLMGGLLWGGGSNIKLSLDRGDLWDLRTPKPLLADDWTYATIRKLVQQKNQKRMVAMFDRPYNAYPYPTKIPAGRLELTFAKGQIAKEFRVDLSEAVGRVDFGGGGRIEAFYSAVQPVAVLRITGDAPAWKIVAPAALKKLGYAPAKTAQADDGRTRWSLQEAALGLKYAVVVSMRPEGDATLIAVSITSTGDGADPVAMGRKRVGAALAAGYEALLKPHRKWWRGFWSRSGVRLPDRAAQAHYDLVQYYYGSASRRGAPPMPLQGVWTADQGTLPPWKGDYHHDLNTQFTYYAYQAAGRFDQGACFLDFMWNHLPAHRKFARKFFAAPGAAVPGVMTLDGKAMGGWGQYSLSPTMGAWVGHLFYLHWRYTMDDKFLRQRAYPYCAEIARCIAHLLRPGADGKLKLPLSTSPEIHNNSMRAWLTPNTNNDLSLLRWLFAALAEMADAAGKKTESVRWRKMLGQLDSLAVEGTDGALKLSPDEALMGSHRHHAHLMAIHPMGVLNVDGGRRSRAIIDASLAHTRKLGTRAWCGYSFSWMSCMQARVGRGDEAGKYLGIYLEAFLSRNGFHVNGDQSGKGYANARYRPFTLEGNFAASQAVHEMLLQTWGGVVRIFPAVPKAWADVSFHDLRGEGGYVISATRRAGKTARLTIRATRAGAVRLRNPFGADKVTWSLPVKKVNGLYEFRLRAGETLSAKTSE